MTWIGYADLMKYSCNLHEETLLQFLLFNDILQLHSSYGVYFYSYYEWLLKRTWKERSLAVKVVCQILAGAEKATNIVVGG